MWIKKFKKDTKTISEESFNEYTELKESLKEAANWDKVFHYDGATILSDIEYYDLKDEQDAYKNYVASAKAMVEENKSLKAELEKYKRLYLDEYQKRLELAGLLKANSNEYLFGPSNDYEPL